MGDTVIGWTNKTWNPVTGCSHVSEGCRHCYAETLSLRMGWSKLPWTARNAAANVVLHPERLRAPLSWRTPCRVFVNSMSDLFHEQVPDEFLARVWVIMARTPQHTYQILTKRPERMARALGPRGIGVYRTERVVPCPQPNVWLGVSAEDQETWDYRLEFLGRTSAAVRFVSAEPLLGDIDVGNAFDDPSENDPYGRIHWLIVGGESGPHHRPMDPAWLESLVKQATLADVPVFVKQDSGPRPGLQGRLSDAVWSRKEWP